MKNKTQLLAELTLMQESAQNALKHGLDEIVFHSKCIAEFAESAKVALEEDYDNTAEIFKIFAKRLKNHWKHSPSLFNTIDKELALAIAELKEVEAKQPLKKGEFRVKIEDGTNGRASVVYTHALKLFYLDPANDGNPSLKDFMRNGCELDEILFYVSMRERCKGINEASNGKFEKVYQDYLKEFKLEEILKGEV